MKPKNIYFKAWNMKPRLIAVMLLKYGLKFKVLGNKFYIRLTPGMERFIRKTVNYINQDNEAIIYESEIDYTRSKIDICRQIKICYKKLGLVKGHGL